MKVYRVEVPFACYVTVEVEADSEEDAIEEAMEDAWISGFCGNGGTDKLIGVSGDNVSIEAGDCPLEHGVFSITAELVEQE